MTQVALPSSHRCANNLANRTKQDRTLLLRGINLPAQTFLLPGTVLLPGGTVLLLLGIPHC